MKRALKFFLLSLALCAAQFCGSAHAQYPNRPIKLVVPFTPGTGIDILARVFAQKLQDRMKNPVVVENRPGASGNIGTEAVAKAPADGYTLLNAELAAILGDTETRAGLLKQGLSPCTGTPAELAKLIETDLERWAGVVREARIPAD